jgi:hypothetical protein
MKTVTKKQAKELRALAAMPDDKIDLSDIPEVRDWSRAVVGKFYRPAKNLGARRQAQPRRQSQ